MFNRANLYPRCKKYSKYLKSVSNNLARKKDTITHHSYKKVLNISSNCAEYLNTLGVSKNNLVSKKVTITDYSYKKVLNISSNCAEYLNTLGVFKDGVLSTNYIDKYRKSLYIIQNNLLEKYNSKKVNNLRKQHSINNLQNKFLKKRFLCAVGLNAVGLHIVENPSDTTTELPKVIDPIPEPPPIPEASGEILNQLNALGEPTFASLGLGGSSPIGIVQACFEYLHVTLGIPWWEAIAIGTLIIRICMFPLVIIAQRNAAKMNNYMPQLQVLQLKMTEARQTGNQLEVARYSQEMMLFMKEKNLNPFKNMIVPLAQMPVFISFFMGLRQMANVPVESLRSGGLFWFTDLTVPDQFFALPVITSLTLWATIELGTDSAKLSAQNLQTMKYVLRALPFVILPFTVNFPGAILCYWVASNFISLAQVGFLRIPAVRDYFNIEPHLRHNPSNLPIQSKGFVGGIKDSWTNIKITKELEERRRLDEMQFQRAGKGPVVKTYKFDPTKQVASNPNAISAKKS